MLNDQEITTSQERVTELVKLILRVGGVGVFVNLFKDAKITCNGETTEINGGERYFQVTGTYNLAGPLKELSDEVMFQTMSFTNRELFNRSNQGLAIGVADMQMQVGESKKQLLGFIVGVETDNFPAKNIFIITLPKVDGESLLNSLKQDPALATKLFDSLVGGLDDASPMVRHENYKMIISLQKRVFGVPVPLQPQYRNKEVLTGSLVKEGDGE